MVKVVGFVDITSRVYNDIMQESRSQWLPQATRGFFEIQAKKLLRSKDYLALVELKKSLCAQILKNISEFAQ